MENLNALIDRLINLSIENELITERDCIYVRNRLLALFNETEYEIPNTSNTSSFYEVLDALTEIGVQKGLIQNTVSQKDIFSSTMMNMFLPLPHVIEDTFWKNYEKSPKLATDTFFKMSQNVNYIKVNRIAKNIVFKAPSVYGNIDITINLSKPEKDPKEIARLKTAPPNKYPSCLLCIENEGYKGTLTLPDRANHRLIALSLNNKEWMLQYSPYQYYQEHCILLSKVHEPMKISKDSFYNLLHFVKLFPHYFLGSNADLPIVGGSILAHEHYQGGRYTFPMDHAKTIFEFKLKQYPQIDCRLLNWPLSTIELCSSDMDAIAEASNDIFEAWKNYSDPDIQILAYSGSTRHNTVTPIARMKDGKYVMRIVLRNNRTTAEHPLGIFHPHKDVQHIKKENIGLIEVMGLAILPARLLTELDNIKRFIKGQDSDVAHYHMAWAKKLKENYQPALELDDYIEKAVGAKFTRVLEDAGVFKMTEEGISHFKAFVNML